MDNDTTTQGNLLVNILGIAKGNSQGNSNAGRRRVEQADRSRSWSKSRGHKSHGKKHCK